MELDEFILVGTSRSILVGIACGTGGWVGEDFGVRMGQSSLGRGAIVSFVGWGSGTAEAESIAVVEIARPGEKGSLVGDTVV